ncbi:MAG: transporter substrate-binding domain-containing protein [Lachnospiraceae bacterium]|nr:transporter substrate-binding domain-containing protein [Lachnospiraceae bacterium]
MKNKYLRKLSAIIVASLTLLSLTACGSSATATTQADTDGSTSEAQSETVNEQEATADDTVEVKTIKAVTGGNPRPYVYVGEDDVPTGYDIEVLKAVFDLLPQYELEIEVADFSAVFAGLNAGNYQIGVNNFSYNAERASSYLYSLPYDKVSYVFVFNKDAEPITSLADAAGKSFEGGAGVSVTNAVEAWNELNPDNPINITYTDADTAVELQHIEDGATDFGIIDGPMYTAYTEEYGFDVAKYDIPEEETKLIADNLYAYYLLPKDQEQLRNEIDEAIIQLKENGTLKQLSEQFFGGVDQSPEEEVLKAGKTN